MGSVLIKNQRYGLTVRLPEEGSFDELRQEVAQKFTEASRFFGPARLTLTFEGRHLTEQEEDALVAIIEKSSEIKIICIFVNDDTRNSVFVRARNIAQIQYQSPLRGQAGSRRGQAQGGAAGNVTRGQGMAGDPHMQQMPGDANAYPGSFDESAAYVAGTANGDPGGNYFSATDPNGPYADAFYADGYHGALNDTINGSAGRSLAGVRGTQTDVSGTPRSSLSSFMTYPGNLKNGEMYKTRENILVLGDIEEDAALISEKNIVVVGAIYGSVRAGEGSQTPGHFVISSNLVPKRLDIDGNRYLGKTKKSILGRALPGLAVVKEDEVVIEQLSEEVLQDLLHASDLNMKDPGNL